MKTILLEVIKLARNAKGEVGGQDYMLSLSIDEDIVGMYIAEAVLLSIGIHLASSSSNHQQKMPELFLGEFPPVCLPDQDLFLEVGYVLVFKPRHEGTTVTACS